MFELQRIIQPQCPIPNENQCHTFRHHAPGSNLTKLKPTNYCWSIANHCD